MINQKIKTLEDAKANRYKKRKDALAPVHAQFLAARTLYDELSKKHDKELLLKSQVERNIRTLKENLVVYDSRIEKARFMVTQMVNLYSGKIIKENRLITALLYMADAYSASSSKKSSIETYDQQQERVKRFEGYKSDFQGWADSGFAIPDMSSMVDMSSMGETIGSGISSGGELLGSVFSGLISG
jgi:hypothetical protein